MRVSFWFSAAWKPGIWHWLCDGLGWGAAENGRCEPPCIAAVTDEKGGGGGGGGGADRPRCRQHETRVLVRCHRHLRAVDASRAGGWHPQSSASSSSQRRECQLCDPCYNYLHHRLNNSASPVLTGLTDGSSSTFSSTTSSCVSFGSSCFSSVSLDLDFFYFFLILILKCALLSTSLALQRSRDCALAANWCCGAATKALKC